MAVTTSTDDVIAFRLAAHHLTPLHPTDDPDPDAAAHPAPDAPGPSPGPDRPTAAGACGIQDSPPGSALLSLHARTQHATQAQVADALGEQRTLLRTWAMRGAPFVVPTAEAAVFTTGVLPPTEESMRHLLPGVEPALDRLGMTLTEAVDLTDSVIRDVLAGRRLDITDLGVEVAARVATALPPSQRDTWWSEGPYAAGQPLGEGVVHFCVRILTLRGVVCFAPRAGATAPFVLVDEWLGHPLPDVDPDLARAELLRRYLHCYGPSTRADLAAWLGVRPGDTGPWWDLVEGELTPVGFRGTSWLLTADLDALRSPPRPTGVRLLPPHDPYTQQRDRDTIVAPQHHREVWRPVGDPGTVLVRGTIAGTWRPRKRGRTLTLTVTTFDDLAARDLAALRQEAEQVARLRGASAAEVVVAPR